jgi:hypothetical protein
MDRGERAAPIVEITSEGSYSSIWLKYVTSVDLGVHCIRSLVGRRCARIDAGAPWQRLRLDEHPRPAAYYLCAVSQPYAWGDNAHLAFEHAPGERWAGIALVPQLRVVLQDARPITGWGGHSVPADAPHAHDPRYATCRNWQFAWHLHIERELPHRTSRRH